MGIGRMQFRRTRWWLAMGLAVGLGGAGATPARAEEIKVFVRDRLSASLIGLPL